MKKSVLIGALMGVAVVGAAVQLVLPVTQAEAEQAQAAMRVENAYLRTSTPSSKSGAAFLEVTNDTGADDVLIGASSELAGMVQLHSHSQDSNGVMRMGEIEGGVPIAAGETHVFKRGGDHLMFMGLTEPLDQGREVSVTLIFETAGEVHVMIPVDRDR